MTTYYKALTLGGAALVVPALWLRALSNPGDGERLRERLGRLALRDRQPGSLWLQAVSVGEVRVAETLAGALRRSGFSSRLALSATTPAGLARAERSGSGTGDVFAFPLDLDPFVRRTLDALRPAAYGSIETEIWPGLLGECARRGIPTFIASGSISERSARRYRLIAGAVAPALASLRAACMQSAADAERLVALGARAEAVVVTGDIKFDAAPRDGALPPATLAAELGLAGGRPVLVAGSTAPGEEAIVLDAWRLAARAVPDLVLVVAPRHRERFEEVAAAMAKAGAVPLRRSRGAAGTARHDAVLLDTIGELETAYALADLAFVGGSLVPRGGQNPLEPARAGVPILFGPGMDNFREAASALVACGAAFVVRDADSLAARAVALLGDRAARERAGAAGREFVAAHAGATARTLTALRERIPAVFGGLAG